MPNSSVTVTTANSRRTGKDQGKIVVAYRNTAGKTYNAYVLSAAATTPSGAAVANLGTPGSTTYSYRITGVDAGGTEGPASTAATTATGAAVLNGTDKNRITWNAMPGAAAYNVYGRTGGSELKMTPTAITALTFDDNGSVTPSGALPSAPAASDVNLYVPSTRRFRFRVPLATAVKSTNVYFNR
jgi:hypothetical protein